MRCVMKMVTDLGKQQPVHHRKCFTQRGWTDYSSFCDCNLSPCVSSKSRKATETTENVAFSFGCFQCIFKGTGFVFLRVFKY